MYRLSYLMLLSTVAVGCSTNSSVWPSGNTQVAAPLRADVRRNALLSEGFGEESIQRTRASSWIAPEVSGGRLNIYWGNYYSNTIAIYPRSGVNPPEKGVISKGLSHPQRLFVDTALDVYATNAGNNTITAYKPNAARPSLKISAGIDTPTGLAVDADGTVYCANVGNDSITVYRKGQTIAALTTPVPGSPEYLAIDGSHNLYVSYLGGPLGTGVMEFAPGSTSGRDLGLDVSGAGALEVDGSGNIVITNDYGLSIDVFASNQTEPSKVVSLGGGRAFGLSLSEKEHHLFVSVETPGTFVVDQLDYPNLTNLTTKLSSGAGNWPIAAARDAVF